MGGGGEGAGVVCSRTASIHTRPAGAMPLYTWIVYTHLCVYRQIYVSTHVSYIYVYIYTYVYVYMYVYKYIYIYLYIYVYVYIQGRRKEFF